MAREPHTKILARKGNKAHLSNYDNRTKRYIGVNSPLSVPEVNIIKIDLGNNTLHYCYHPTEKSYVRIQPPKDFQTKYIALASGAHMI